LLILVLVFGISMRLAPGDAQSEASQHHFVVVIMAQVADKWPDNPVGPVLPKVRKFSRA